MNDLHLQNLELMYKHSVLTYTYLYNKRLTGLLEVMVGLTVIWNCLHDNMSFPYT